MRIHTNTLESDAIYRASQKACVWIEFSEHGSRSHERSFDVKLTGNSRRRPNGGNYGAADDYAATWDQWGVFLGALFDADPTIKTWADANGAAFSARTNGRFDDLDEIPFPLDHDHRFVPTGVPRQSACTKCDAVQTWSL